jgi:hypothetical protein
MAMAKEVEIYEKGQLEQSELTVDQLVARQDLIKEAMTSAMTPGVHYGKIQGIAKPSLFKPGAEKLCSLFMFDPEYDSETSFDDEGHFHVKSKATLFHIPTGNRVASGEGYCSTAEKQYRKVPNRADIYNTIVKMSNKRALVAAVLNATAASDVFTQDVEDAPRGGAARRTSTAPPPRADTYEPVSPATRADLEREITLNSYAKNVWSEESVISTACERFGRNINELTDLYEHEAQMIIQVAKDWREAHPPPELDVDQIAKDIEG